LSFLDRLFRLPDDRAALRPLYEAVVAAGRDPAWYREGGVPDTMDGRFDVITAVLSLALIRLEAEGEATRRETVLLTEVFIDDMDGTLRQIGIGDIVVGKHIGKLMGALGGRLGAYRAGLGGEGLEDDVRRNIFRDAPPSEEAVAWVAARLRRLHAVLGETPLQPILEGKLPTP
jgi:cytochrome b pre-mRNA-processing protein 3